MRSRLPFGSLALFVGFFQLSSTSAVAQELSQLCHPVLTAPITVATPGNASAAGAGKSRASPDGCLRLARHAPRRDQDRQRLRVLR